MDAYEFLQKSIMVGKLAPGQRLTEVMLAEQLQISRTPIRNALQRLEFDGLITPLKKGYVVSEFSKEHIVQIYDLRALLEGFASFEAARHRTSIHLKQMYEANERFIYFARKNNEFPHDETVEQVVYYNKIFHDTIIAASGNDYLHKQLRQVILLPFMYRSFHSYDAFQMQRSIDAHEALYEAIEQKHPERAKVAAQNHVYQALQHILKI